MRDKLVRKRIMSSGFLILILLIGNTLIGCGRVSMDSQEIYFSFNELPESENLSNISLTIYYKDLLVFTRAPVSLEQLTGGWYDNAGQLVSGIYTYRIVVSGDKLEEHRDMINQLLKAELLPTETESVVDARLYYVFEHREYGELFSVLAFGSGTGSVFVNGIEVEHNRVFFEMVLPFLPDDAVTTIGRYIEAMENSA